MEAHLLGLTYVVVATYTHRPPEGPEFSEYQSSVELGFTKQTKSPSIYYKLEIY